VQCTCGNFTIILRAVFCPKVFLYAYFEFQIFPLFPFLSNLLKANLNLKPIQSYELYFFRKRVIFQFLAIRLSFYSKSFFMSNKRFSLTKIFWLKFGTQTKKSLATSDVECRQENIWLLIELHFLASVKSQDSDSASLEVIVSPEHLVSFFYQTVCEREWELERERGRERECSHVC